MALIECSECGKEISDKAGACPNCGNPLNPAPANQVQTVEATGKQFKAAQAVGFILALIGVILLFTEVFIVGGFFCVIGLIALLYGSIGAWWHHA